MGYASYNEKSKPQQWVSALVLVNVRTTDGHRTQVLKVELSGKDVPSVLAKVKAHIDLTDDEPFVVEGGTDA